MFYAQSTNAVISGRFPSIEAIFFHLKLNNARSGNNKFFFFFFFFLSLVCFVASDFLTTICHLAIVNVCVIIILSTGNTQISILLLCFLYLFSELIITMNE